MTVIARRVGGIWIAYLLLAVGGAAIVISSKYYGLGVYGYIMGGILAAVGVWESVDYLRVPSSILLLEGRYTLCLPRGVRIDAKDITNISHRRATSRGRQYGWGTVVISTATAEYKLHFVADCEGVEDALSDLVEKRQSEIEEFPLD